MAGGRLAALFRADARDDQPADALLVQPDREPRADQRAVAVLVDCQGRRVAAQAVERPDQATGGCEGVGRLVRAVRVEDLHDRQAEGEEHTGLLFRLGQRMPGLGESAEKLQVTVSVPLA